MPTIAVILLLLLASSAYFLIFGGLKKLIRFFMLAIILAYFSAGVAGISLAFFPPGWGEGSENAGTHSFAPRAREGSIVDKVMDTEIINIPEIKPEIKIDKANFLIFLQPKEIIGVLNTQNGLYRAGVIFLGLFLVVWLKS